MMIAKAEAGGWREIDSGGWLESIGCAMMRIVAPASSRRSAMRRFAYGSRENTMASRKSTVNLDMPLDTAFERCREALIQFGAKIKSEDRDEGLIEAKAGMS